MLSPTECSPQLLRADVYSGAADFSTKLDDLYDYCSRQVVSAPSATATVVDPVSPPEATTSPTVPKPAVLLRVPDPTRPDRLREAPSGPLEAQGSNPDMATIISALNAVLGYLEHLSGVEKEIVEKEGWNFDATTALLDLTKRMGRIPFGGGTSTQFDVQPSTESSKGKERETTPTLDSGTRRSIYNLDPKESVGSWLGQSSVEGECRFVFPTSFSILLRRPIV